MHRDLKPSNVLLALDGPKVIDFGIARAVEDTALTTTGKVIGSPGFMCPEQVTGESVVPASDIFALGGILVFAATGHGPFGTGDTVHMLWRVVYEEPRLDAVPERLRPLIASCLSKDVAARPTPRQLMEQLDLLGVPRDGGWLPSPVVHEVSRRAVQLLDLDSGPHDLPHEIRSHSPATGSGSFTPPPTAQPPYTGPPRQHTGYGPGGDPSAPGRHEPTRHNTPPPSPVWQTPQGSTQPGSMPQPGRYDAQSAPPPPTKNRTRAALIAGLLVVAIAVAFGAFFIGTRLHNDSKDSADSSETSTEESTDTESTDITEPESTSASSDTHVPQAFLGSWRGTAKDAVFTFDIEVVLGEGGIGDEVGESANTGKLAGARCVRAESLNSANETEIVLTARLTENGGGCLDDGSQSTLTLQADGSLSYTTSGLAGPMTGVLRKVQ